MVASQARFRPEVHDAAGRPDYARRKQRTEGYGQDADRQATRDAGFDYDLAKPVDFKTIESTLATVERT